MLKSHDGKVFYREWFSVQPKAVIILVHGMGGYSGRFFEMGAILAKSGFQVYALDQHGHGENPSAKGHIDNAKVFTKDLLSLVNFAKQKNMNKKIFIFGESMGGLITLDLSIHHQKLLSGIILMSPALVDKFIPISRKIDIFKALPFSPQKYFNAGFRSDIFTRDTIMAKRIESDPLEVRKFTAKFYFAILKEIIFVMMMPSRIMLPVLMLLGGQDKMIDADANKNYFKKIASKDKTLKFYPEMYHALYVDKDREKVFADIIEWVRQRC